MNKNKAKTDKNEHEIGKRSKAGAGEVKWSKSKLKMTKLTSEIHKVPSLVPRQSFEVMATSVPALSGNYINGPLK